MVEEVEWFSNRMGTLLGTIARGKNAAGWNYVILKRAKKGDPRVCKVMNNFFSAKAAQVDLLLSMGQIEKIGGAGREPPNLELPAIAAELVTLTDDERLGQRSEARS